MWDSKTASGKDISVSTTTTSAASESVSQPKLMAAPDSITKLSGHNLEKNIDIDQSSSRGIDSGFLSSEQFSASDIQDYDIEETESSSNLAAPFSGDDKTSKTSSTDILDSGVIDDDYSPDSQKDSGPMLLDSGVDVGLSEWFCNLSLKNPTQPLNNLGGQKGSSKKSSSVLIGDSNGKSTAKSTKLEQSWETYYQQNIDGDTQLHLAIMHGYIDVVRALIRIAPHPCLLDIQNDLAQSPLHLAVIVGQPEIARRLLVAGAEATLRDKNGNTALHLACINGDFACVQALTKPVAATEIQEVFRDFDQRSQIYSCTQLPPDLEQRNYDGEKCVHLAAQGNYVDVLRHLVWYGADINSREGKSGRTPLHFAIEQNNEVLVNFLLDECPKLSLETCTYAGLTAYQLAAITCNKYLLNNLLSRGAEPLSPPESDDDSDFDDSQMIDRFGTPGFFQKFNGGKTINVA